MSCLFLRVRFLFFFPFTLLHNEKKTRARTQLYRSALRHEDAHDSAGPSLQPDRMHMGTMDPNFRPRSISHIHRTTAYRAKCHFTIRHQVKRNNIDER